MSSSRRPVSDSAEQAAASDRCDGGASNGDAVRDADVVVLAVPHGAVAGIVAELGDALEGKVVVDAPTRSTRPTPT